MASKTGQTWTTKPDGEYISKIPSSSSGELPPITLIDAFKETVSKFRDKPALRVKRNGSWVTWSYDQYYNDVTRAAKSMLNIGLDPYHGVGIIGFNSPEWIISFMASIMAGGIGVGVYATNNKEICQFIAENSKAQLIICENKKQLDKILAVKQELPDLKAIVKYLPEYEETIDPEAKATGVLTWEEFMEIGRDMSDEYLSSRVDNLKVNHCASLVYTSGTTGLPKGVMLSHDNITWSARTIAQIGETNEMDSHVSFLPLSHIAAQMSDILLPSISGFVVNFAQPDALKGTLKDTLLDVRPTQLVSVPRVYEKFRDALETQMNDAKGIKKFIIETSKSIGRRTQANRLRGSSEAFGYTLANKLVYKNIREKIGLNRCRNVMSGAAPLPMAVTEYLGDFDIPIYQLYGMSECTGVATYNLKGHYKPGSAGITLPGTEMKLDKPDENGEGEICFRGRHVFMGYLQDEEKTKEAVDEEGWLHSGDIGRIDQDGFYFITGRLKEIIITKGGENIAPIPIEEKMKEYDRLLSNVIVVGDEQRFLTMLVTLRCEFDDDRNPIDELDPIAKQILNEIGSEAKKVSIARTDPIVIQHIHQGMERANEKAVSRAAHVQKFTILPVDFSIEAGDLTPTMKMKRKVILEKYQAEINHMYS